MRQSQILSQSGSFRGEPSGTKKGSSRRSWSSIEERVLLDAFKDIIVDGWKSPNGYRTGYLQQLEARLRMALPGTDIRGDPHILSKYTTWKKTYREVQKALGKTGMGWNSTLKTVTATSEHWDNLALHSPDLAYIREKPFPYYETWVEIYGRDGATGNRAFDFTGAATDADGTGNGTEEIEETNTETPLGDDVENNTQSQASTPVSTNARADSKGKRKRVDGVDEIVDTISKLMGDATKALNNIANALQAEITARVEVQAAGNRRRLYEAISELPLTLTRADRVRVTSILVKQPDMLDVFFELPVAERCDVVLLALEGVAL